jgi:hypothetical protein
VLEGLAFTDIACTIPNGRSDCDAVHCSNQQSGRHHRQHLPFLSAQSYSGIQNALHTAVT